ncbi:tetraprenyl-beta-curcumene synthase family protein [Desulforudis sp. 1088]|uniref:tetraprenyl-beta-curcumene synthase family protein n=1 Tax=unclassified Candidatus Desulforudis TaxID=2635950 RepID=UPI003BE25CEF
MTVRFTGHLPRQITTLGRLIAVVLPDVNGQLRRWRTVLVHCKERELAKQAELSMRHKRFHCQGGSVFALNAGRYRRGVLRLIVALQTISDYLDNLCDRAGCLDARAFRTLHRAMTCAVNPEQEIPDFYADYPLSDDGGYLRALVEECRAIVALLPSYSLVQPEVTRLAGLYSDLQVFKHTEPELRVPLLSEWFARHRPLYPDLYWWEFAAATGSTLAMFALFAAAADPRLEDSEIEKILKAYFPWICGLHILLDYYIDQEEDRLGGDLNFVSYYPDPETRQKRLLFFMQRALAETASLPRPWFHRMVVKGLPALYLSDPKVHAQGLNPVAGDLLRAAGPGARILHDTCRALRRLKQI